MSDNPPYVTIMNPQISIDGTPITTLVDNAAWYGETSYLSPGPHTLSVAFTTNYNVPTAAIWVDLGDNLYDENNLTNGATVTFTNPDSNALVSDLSAQFTTEPQSPIVPGATGTAAFTLNNGGDPATGSVYASFDLAPVGGGESIQHVGAVSAQINSNVVSPDPIPVNFTIPAGTPSGTYELVGTLTEGSQIVDVDSNDKTFFSSPITITSESDLHAAFTSNLPTPLQPGQSSNTGFSLQNGGPNDANGTYSINFTLETAPSPGNGDIPVDTATGSIDLATGNTSDPISANITIPRNTSPGTYYLIGTLTDGGGITDPNTNDKTFVTHPIQITAQPDLTISIDSLPKSASLDSTITISSTVSNAQQSATATGTDETTFWLSNDNSTDVTGDLLLSPPNDQSLDLDAGDSVSFDTQIKIPKNIAAGTYYIKAFTNSQGAIQESNTTNNIGVSVPITITAPATQLVFDQQPTDTKSGRPFSPTVTVDVESANGLLATDDDSEVTLNINTGPADGPHGAIATARAVNGIATFANLSISNIGTYSLLATEGQLAPSISNAFAIRAIQVKIVKQPTTVIAGNSATPAMVVDVDDAAGNIATDDSSIVTISVTQGPGEFSEFQTIALHGVATFHNLIFHKAGSYTLKISDEDLTPASAKISVKPNKAVRVAFLHQPTSAIAGANFAPAISLQLTDIFGNLVTNDSFKVTVSISSGPTGGKLLGTTTVAVKNGLATFSGLSLQKAGSYKLKAVDSSDALAAISGVITVAAAAPVTLNFSRQPKSATAGAILSPPILVTAQDLYGNPGTAASVRMAIASGPTGGILAGTLLVVTHNGIATFANLSLQTPGTYTLKVTLGKLSVTSSKFTISPKKPKPAFVPLMRNDSELAPELKLLDERI